MTSLAPPLPEGPSATTPAGLQSTADLARRRLIVVVANVALFLALAEAAAKVLGAGGWTLLDVLLFICFLCAAPWGVVGFCNAMIGFWLLHGVDDGMQRAAPFAEAGQGDAKLIHRTAIVMTLRNEPPERAFARIAVVKAQLDASGQGAAFGYFLLSDTSEPEVARLEEIAFADWRDAQDGKAPMVYRRRADNAGFKAGNLREFCAAHGNEYEFMLALDADSLMSGEAILMLVRMAQAHPKLGILQSLVVGAPSTSGFARIFQFGMRHGMRPYTIGAAWWGADCGPFWGHNAIVRIAPFMQHCELPMLPGKPPLGGAILSHDQVEAVLMRRAGYEVRVLPQEIESYEDNPPTLPEFSRRDMRWCQGNMQYIKLLGQLKGLEPMSRFQLIWAILMFAGLPATYLFILLAALKPFDTVKAQAFPATAAMVLCAVYLLLQLSPKLVGFVDVALRKGELARYGGGLRFATGAIVELVFSFLMSAIVGFRTALFMVGLVFGSSVIWGGQARDAHGVPLPLAFSLFWPCMAYGILVLIAFAIFAPAALPWLLPFVGGLAIAAPFVSISASEKLGELLARWKLCGIPEDFVAPSCLQALRAAEKAETELLHPAFKKSGLSS